MNKDKYIGHDSQLFGVEEHRLVGGKGDGMRLFQVRNGLGLEFTVSADRCADISRMSFEGINYGYFAPCGYVAPAYYDDTGSGFLKSFTAGFLTTCGLQAAGTPCVDDGEDLPLHGTVGNCPVESVSTSVTDSEIILRARINQENLFGSKLVMDREIICSLEQNEILIRDRIKNRGCKSEPLMLLYHMNIGYPLLDSGDKLFIPSTQVQPRNEHAAEDMDMWNQIPEPTAGFEEQCYYHSFDRNGVAAIFNEKLGKGLCIRFCAEQLDTFTEWKMMGERDYVLGLEPGNCHVDGRDKMRAERRLKFLSPGESKEYQVKISVLANEDEWNRIQLKQR